MDDDYLNPEQPDPDEEVLLRQAERDRQAARLRSGEETTEEDPFPLPEGPQSWGEGLSCPHCGGLGGHRPCCPVGVEKAAERAIQACSQGWDGDPEASCRELAAIYDAQQAEDPDSPYHPGLWALHWRMVGARIRDAKVVPKTSAVGGDRLTALEHLNRPQPLTAAEWDALPAAVQNEAPTEGRRLGRVGPQASKPKRARAKGKGLFNGGGDVGA